MSACTTCGTSTGLFGSAECDNCRIERDRQARRDEADQRKARWQAEKQRRADEATARQQGKATWLAERQNQLAASLKLGLPVSLTESLYVGIKAEGVFDISEVQQATLDGWEIVGVVPLTLASASVLMRLPVTRENQPTLGPVIAKHLEDLHDRGRST
jgi:hypothetical protein